MYVLFFLYQLLLHSCQVTEIDTVFGEKESFTRKLLFPASASGRHDLLQEIYSTSKPLQLSVEAEEYIDSTITEAASDSAMSKSTSLPVSKYRITGDMYILPAQQIHVAFQVNNIVPKSLGVVLSPNINDGGFATVENQIKSAMSRLRDAER